MQTFGSLTDETPVHLNKTITDWDSFTEVVKDKSNLTLLKKLDLLLDDDNLLTEAAKHSYRHQLGFWKYVLMSNTVGGSLRLHLWDNSSYLEEDIHSHCTDFYSRVITGQVTEKSFELTPGTSHKRFRYRFDNELGHSTAIADGATGVSVQSNRVLSAGMEYRKCAMDLHNISNVEPGTMTLSAWGSRNGDAIVLKKTGSDSKDCIAQVGINKYELRTALLSIKKRITG
ncbi:hypothetical protein [Pseudomonas helleri]|uniref:hypothetical protein n=1 Tax=Pseudomonas helleri TaxID=1608996 RepID=UPI003FD47F78